ncbi:MAG: hypothetical protein JAY72_07925 [Candidatus Thiodiazotropha endolucinida]|nr:hypothetical protein [Candidatus Thiodiazotropha taylori]MCW4321594.1 hypothetical protein [Candidatus Thiodiazotropha taylori]
MANHYEKAVFEFSDENVPFSLTHDGAPSDVTGHMSTYSGRVLDHLSASFIPAELSSTPDLVPNQETCIKRPIVRAAISLAFSHDYAYDVIDKYNQEGFIVQVWAGLVATDKTKSSHANYFNAKQAALVDTGGDHDKYWTANSLEPWRPEWQADRLAGIWLQSTAKAISTAKDRHITILTPPTSIYYEIVYPAIMIRRRYPQSTTNWDFYWDHTIIYSRAPRPVVSNSYSAAGSITFSQGRPHYDQNNNKGLKGLVQISNAVGKLEAMRQMKAAKPAASNVGALDPADQDRIELRNPAQYGGNLLYTLTDDNALSSAADVESNQFVKDKAFLVLCQTSMAKTAVVSYLWNNNPNHVETWAPVGDGKPLHIDTNRDFIMETPEDAETNYGYLIKNTPVRRESGNSPLDFYWARPRKLSSQDLLRDWIEPHDPVRRDSDFPIVNDTSSTDSKKTYDALPNRVFDESLRGEFYEVVFPNIDKEVENLMSSSVSGEIISSTLSLALSFSDEIEGLPVGELILDEPVKPNTRRPSHVEPKGITLPNTEFSVADPGFSFFPGINFMVSGDKWIQNSTLCPPKPTGPGSLNEPHEIEVRWLKQSWGYSTFNFFQRWNYPTWARMLEYQGAPIYLKYLEACAFGSPGLNLLAGRLNWRSLRGTSGWYAPNLDDSWLAFFTTTQSFGDSQGKRGLYEKDDINFKGASYYSKRKAEYPEAGEQYGPLGSAHSTDQLLVRPAIGAIGQGVEARREIFIFENVFNLVVSSLDPDNPSYSMGSFTDAHEDRSFIPRRNGPDSDTFTKDERTSYYLGEDLVSIPINYGAGEFRDDSTNEKSFTYYAYSFDRSGYLYKKRRKLALFRRPVYESFYLMPIAKSNNGYACALVASRSPKSVTTDISLYGGIKFYDWDTGITANINFEEEDSVDDKLSALPFNFHSYKGDLDGGFTIFQPDTAAPGFDTVFPVSSFPQRTNNIAFEVMKPEDPSFGANVPYLPRIGSVSSRTLFNPGLDIEPEGFRYHLDTTSTAVIERSVLSFSDLFPSSSEMPDALPKFEAADYSTYYDEDDKLIVIFSAPLAPYPSAALSAPEYLLLFVKEKTAPSAELSSWDLLKTFDLANSQPATYSVDASEHALDTGVSHEIKPVLLFANGMTTDFSESEEKEALKEGLSLKSADQLFTANGQHYFSLSLDLVLFNAWEEGPLSITVKIESEGEIIERNVNLDSTLKHEFSFYFSFSSEGTSSGERDVQFSITKEGSDDILFPSFTETINFSSQPFSVAFEAPQPDTLTESPYAVAADGIDVNYPLNILPFTLLPEIEDVIFRIFPQSADGTFSPETPPLAEFPYSENSSTILFSRKVLLSSEEVVAGKTDYYRPGFQIKLAADDGAYSEDIDIAPDPSLVAPEVLNAFDQVSDSAIHVSQDNQGQVIWLQGWRLMPSVFYSLSDTGIDWYDPNSLAITNANGKLTLRPSNAFYSAAQGSDAAMIPSLVTYTDVSIELFAEAGYLMGEPDTSVMQLVYPLTPEPNEHPFSSMEKMEEGHRMTADIDTPIKITLKSKFFSELLTFESIKEISLREVRHLSYIDAITADDVGDILPAQKIRKITIRAEAKQTNALPDHYILTVAKDKEGVDIYGGPYQIPLDGHVDATVPADPSKSLGEQEAVFFLLSGQYGQVKEPFHAARDIDTYKNGDIREERGDESVDYVSRSFTDKPDPDAPYTPFFSTTRKLRIHFTEEASNTRADFVGYFAEVYFGSKDDLDHDSAPDWQELTQAVFGEDQTSPVNQYFDVELDFDVSRDYVFRVRKRYHLLPQTSSEDSANHFEESYPGEADIRSGTLTILDEDATHIQIELEFIHGEEDIPPENAEYLLVYKASSKDKTDLAPAVSKKL